MCAEKATSRVVVRDKVRNDVERLSRFARFVIVLENGVPRVIDNRAHQENGSPFAHLIAVLGPAERKGVQYEKATLLEIGYGRSRPYASLEQSSIGSDGKRLGSRWRIKARRKIRNLSPEELALVYPHLLECITEIVLERRQDWKVKNAWWVDGPGPVERGIHFTVHKSDELLYRQILLEDVRYRRKRYISGHARRIQRLIGGYKYVDYSKAQLMRFKNTGKVITLVRDQYENPFYRQALLRSLGTNSKAGHILDHIGTQFGLGFDQEDERVIIAFSEAPIELPRMQNLHCLIGDRQPKTHGKDCVVAEFILTRRYREQYEVPF